MLEGRQKNGEHHSRRQFSFLQKMFAWKPFCGKKNHEEDSAYDGNFIHPVISPPEDRVKKKIKNNARPMSCPTSPSLSLPSRCNKSVYSELEALRLSRQDDPFFKCLASMESLEDVSILSPTASLRKSSEGLTLDLDPMDVPEFHKHMVRSPPPIDWPYSETLFVDEDEKTGKRRQLKIRCSQSQHVSRESIVSPTLKVPKNIPRSASFETKGTRFVDTVYIWPNSEENGESALQKKNEHEPI